MDKFIYFATVPRATQELLAQYKSPEVEASIWKWVPMEYLDQVRQTLKHVGKFRVVYRGPRGRYHDQAMTWKKDARAFTVY
jgi:hypothetical protein